MTSGVGLLQICNSQIISIFLLPKFQLNTYLMMENIVLRHQLSVLQRTAKRPQFKKRDKLFRIMIYRHWKNWKESLVIMKICLSYPRFYFCEGQHHMTKKNASKVVFAVDSAKIPTMEKKSANVPKQEPKPKSESGSNKK